jgi:hypothetical protein
MVVLTFAAVTVLPAQEVAISDYAIPSLWKYTGSLNPDYGEFGYGRRLFSGFLNIFLGLGSFTMGDLRGGFSILVADALSVGITAGGYYLWSYLLSGSFFSGIGVAGLILFFPIVIAVGAIGVAAVVGGPLSFILTLVHGFNRPFQYNMPGRPPGAPKTLLVNDIRNWNIGIMPNQDGTLSGRLSFTMHF